MSRRKTNLQDAPESTISPRPPIKERIAPDLLTNTESLNDKPQFVAGPWCLQYNCLPDQNPTCTRREGEGDPGCKYYFPNNVRII